MKNCVYVNELPENCLICTHKDCEHQYIECCCDFRHPDCPLKLREELDKNLQSDDSTEVEK